MRNLLYPIYYIVFLKGITQYLRLTHAKTTIHITYRRKDISQKFVYVIYLLLYHLSKPIFKENICRKIGLNFELMIY